MTLKYLKSNQDQINSNQKKQIIKLENLNNKTILYDCAEGKLASPDKGSPKIFSTLTRYNESTPAYQSNSLKSQPQSDSKVIKITLLNLTNVIEHLDNAKFTTMVKGEYQIKKVKINDEIKKSNNKDTNSIHLLSKYKSRTDPTR